MVLGNVASSHLLDGTRSMQLSAISSTPNRTPCGPLLRFGRRITSIERLGGSLLVPRLLSFAWEYSCQRNVPSLGREKRHTY